MKFVGRQRHFAATKICAIGKTRMRADRDTTFMRCADRSENRSWIARVKSTGDIGRADKVENFLIVPAPSPSRH